MALRLNYERRSRLHQWLTQEIGHPKLREHLASIVAILKLSRTPQEFQQNVNRIHPHYNRTLSWTSRKTQPARPPNIQWFRRFRPGAWRSPRSIIRKRRT
jgi:hypothetical protein